MHPHIVYATLDHLDALLPLFEAYREFYERPADPETARAFLRERLANGEAVVLLALTDRNHAAGFTLLYPSFSSLSLRRVWILHDLYVAPFARRAGVGAALMERTLQHAEDTGAEEIQLATATDNIIAQGLYEKLGYMRDEDFYHYFLTVTDVTEDA